MGQRNVLCTNQMIDLEMDQQGQGYLPEPCILLGGVTNFRQPDIPTMVTASGNTMNHDSHLADRYDSAMFYGMPQYRGVHPHPQYHGPNLDLSVATASNFYVPFMAPPSGIPINHGSCDQLSSSNYGVIGVSAGEYGTNGHLLDNARSAYKRKNTEGNPGNFQYLNASASSSSSVAPVNTRHPDGIALVDAASFTPSHYRGTSAPSIREVGSQRSVRNRLGVDGLDPVLPHNQNHFIQGNYLSQPYQPGGPLWLDQHLNNSSTDAGTSGWTHSPGIPYLHGNNVNGSPVETGNMGRQQYHEQANRNNASFSHPSPVNLQHHNFHHLSSPIQGLRGHNINVLLQAPAASFRVPTANASQSTINPSQDGLDIGLRHSVSVQPTGLRMYRPHHEGVVPETILRHRNLPHLRMLPTDGVAILGFPDYYEVENYVDRHRDMRLDIEDMSYEELLALGERIGNVNTGLSEGTIRSQLKTRTYSSFPPSINLEEAACVDQEDDSCIICQDDYKSGEKIAILDCGHEYHVDCLKKWLRLKNVCPICKSEALPTERKDI